MKTAPDQSTLLKRYSLSPLQPFNEAAWNAPGVRERVNCFTYAVGLPALGHAVPGQLAAPEDIQFKDNQMTVDHIRDFLLKDGFEEVDEAEALSTPFQVFALAVHRHNDFHFYRKDADGLWSHKHGIESSISDTDAKGQPIENPATAARGRYKDFGGFFRVPRSGLAYIPRL